MEPNRRAVRTTRAAGMERVNERTPKPTTMQHRPGSRPAGVARDRTIPRVAVAGTKILYTLDKTSHPAVRSLSLWENAIMNGQVSLLLLYRHCLRLGRGGNSREVCQECAFIAHVLFPTPAVIVRIV